MMVQVLDTPRSTVGEGYRVHAAALGFDELARVVEPLRMMRADAFFLLQYPKNDRAAKRYADAGVNVQEELESLKLDQVGVWELDIWNASSVGSFLGSKIQENGYPSLEVNISTGPKPVGIGAALASLFWPIHLYYADVDYETEPGREVDGYPVRGIQRIPTFRAEPIKQEALQALALICESVKPLAAPVLKKRFQTVGLIKPKQGKGDRKSSKLTPQAIHSQYQGLIKPLRDQELIIETIRGGRKLYEASMQGQATLRLLEGYYDDSPVA